MIQYTHIKNPNEADGQVKLSFLILTVLIGISVGAWAENNQVIVSESFYRDEVEVRKKRLNRIHAHLFAANTKISRLDRDIKALINTYKNYLQKFEAAEKLGEVDHSLLKDIGLLLAKLETGYGAQIKNQGQAENCYDLIAAIESLFEKLENPQENNLEELAFPEPGMGIVETYKKLKGEKLPYRVVKNKKKQNDVTEIPAVVVPVKMSKMTSEIVEDDKFTR